MKPLNFLFTLFLTVFISLTVISQPVFYEHNIKFVNISTASLVGEDGVIMQTTDNGITWVEQTSGVTNTLYGNAFFDVNTQIAVGENGVVLKSTDAGTTWIVINAGATQTLNDVEVINSTTAVACGDSGKIYISIDMGDTWLEAVSGTSDNLKDICFVNGQTGIIVGANSTILKTINAGASWDVIPAGFGIENLNTVGIISDSAFTIGGDDGFLSYTLDGGATWNDAGQLTGNIYDVKFFSANNGAAVGDDGMIYITDNGGTSWFNVTPISVGAALDLMSVSFSSPTNGIAVGENGFELYTTDGGLTWTETRESNNIIAINSQDLIVHGNYPNPFNPVTKISFELSKPGMVNVSVFDITGRQVTNLFNGYSNSGMQEFTFNASGLASGIYFYTITAQGSKPVTNKMLLVK